jgi:hypothetical protein
MNLVIDILCNKYHMKSAEKFSNIYITYEDMLFRTVRVSKFIGRNTTVSIYKLKKNNKLHQIHLKILIISYLKEADIWNMNLVIDILCNKYHMKSAEKY